MKKSLIALAFIAAAGVAMAHAPPQFINNSTNGYITGSSSSTGVKKIASRCLENGACELAGNDTSKSIGGGSGDVNSHPTVYRLKRLGGIDPIFMIGDMNPISMFSTEPTVTTGGLGISKSIGGGSSCVTAGVANQTAPPAQFKT